MCTDPEDTFSIYTGIHIYAGIHTHSNTHGDTLTGTLSQGHTHRDSHTGMHRDKLTGTYKGS